MSHRLDILVQTPAHSPMAGTLTYLSELPLSPGSLVRVPLGRRETLGIVWDGPLGGHIPADDASLRFIRAAQQTLPPLPAAWRQLVVFTASYYQRSAGEVALAALPAALRTLDASQLARRLQRLGDAASATLAPPPPPTPQQAAALARIQAESGPFLLFGATGSGKTEVYLRAVQDVLERDPLAQALVLVPEINLTPQLQERFADRFGPQTLATLHSGLTPAQRLHNWLAAHLGRARIVLGTRMAIFASLPRLRLLVVDEEHDPSYKQQEGARYSARDLAVYRARLEDAKVILGSATPSLESWHHSRPAAEGGRYVRLTMSSRVGAAQAQAPLPLVRRVDMNHQPKGAVFAPPLLAALAERIARGEQSLVLLNRRGYAPVLQCAECEWMSQCPHCSVYRVFHKTDRTLRCHHCGATAPVPRACPGCGSPDIRALGRGTQKLEEHLAELLAGVHRPDGAPARIARIDADSTRRKGELESHLAAVHAGEIDVLVGTQMVAKGHDFRRITLVAAIDPDSALFSSDFRAPERLFALLMQAAGRAGRDAALGARSEVWIQTRHPAHPLYAALKAHDYPAFAAQQLAERAQAGLPPFSFQALVRAEARSQDVAQFFLQAAAEESRAIAQNLQVTIYPPVPLGVQRVADVERAQMLLESSSRGALQHFLAGWHGILHKVRAGPAGKGLIRWAVDVDPLII